MVTCASEPAGTFWESDRCSESGLYWEAMVRSDAVIWWTVTLLNQSAIGLEAPGTVQYTG